MEIYEYIDSIISIIKKINDESNNKNEKSIFARIILLGNKIDLEKRSAERKYTLAEKMNCPFNLVSAADGTNVVRVFTFLNYL